MLENNPFVGRWSYRSLLNDPNLTTAFNDLEFGKGTIEIQNDAVQNLTGVIGGPGWSLDLSGSRSYGNPMQVNFQGKGLVGGEEWIYDYIGYLVPNWPNGVQQRLAMVGSIVRAIPHSNGDGGTNPAGVVASWYAVAQP